MRYCFEGSAPQEEVAAKEEPKAEKQQPKAEEGKVCGPEMINTLEQLKISLQNLTYSHSKKDSADSADSKAQSSSGSQKGAAAKVSQTQQVRKIDFDTTTFCYFVGLL